MPRHRFGFEICKCAICHLIFPRLYVQVESLNLLSDSNRLLREERDRQLLQLRELEERCRQLEGEMGPLKESNKSLTAQKDALLAEKTALRYPSPQSHSQTSPGGLGMRLIFLVSYPSPPSPPPHPCPTPNTHPITTPTPTYAPTPHTSPSTSHMSSHPPQE